MTAYSPRCIARAVGAPKQIIQFRSGLLQVPRGARPLRSLQPRRPVRSGYILRRELRPVDSRALLERPICCTTGQHLTLRFTAWSGREPPPGDRPTMPHADAEVSQRVRDWVADRLSRENDLVPGAFPLTEQVVNKQGNLCGTLYCLHGPRSVRLVAVYDYEAARILTYDARGNRTGSYHLNNVLSVDCAAQPA